MKLYKFLNSPKSFNNIGRRSLDSLIGHTPLQLRHNLKENWCSWVSMLNNSSLYDSVDNIVIQKFNQNIKEISKIQPSSIVISESHINKNIEHTYNDIINLLGCHENLTLHALFWATLCSESRKMRLQKYLTTQNHDYSRNILEIFMIMHHDEMLNEEFDFNKILNKVGFNFITEKGLMHILGGVSKHMYDLFKSVLIAWYTDKEEDKQKVSDLIAATSITKENVADVLWKLDELTLHILTGPLYILSTITGWKIRPKSIEKKVDMESIEIKIKDAIQKLNTVVTELPKKVAKNFRAYLKGMQNLVCRDLNVCMEDKQ